jgi:ribosomal protein S18 acetylase RimI-like enzyme
VCDRSEPWERGTVVALTTVPSYYDFNAVRVEGPDPDLEAAELLATVDRLQAGLEHRRIEFDDPAAGARLRPALVAAGYVGERLAWMLRSGPPPAAARDVEEVPFPATRDLRARWHRGEDWSGDELEVLDFLDHQDAVAARRGLRAFAVRGDAGAGRPPGAPVAFATLIARHDAVEVEQVFALPDRRGAGVGSALIETALAHGGRDRAWIVADADGRARRLYERLGFEQVWIQYAFVRYPEPESRRPPA